MPTGRKILGTFAALLLAASAALAGGRAVEFSTACKTNAAASAIYSPVIHGDLVSLQVDAVNLGSGTAAVVIAISPAGSTLAATTVWTNAALQADAGPFYIVIPEHNSDGVATNTTTRHFLAGDKLKLTAESTVTAATIRVVARIAD